MRTRRVILGLVLAGCFAGGVALMTAPKASEPNESSPGADADGSQAARVAPPVAAAPQGASAPEHRSEGELALPPRVVLILIDALRADRLPFYGHDAPPTPFLSSLAARGVVFEHAYAASSWTSSSVASLFTGRYPSEHQVWTGFAMTRRARRSGKPLELNRLPDELPTLAERMRERGYATFGVSNNPNLAEEMGLRRGFDHFEQFREKTGDVINAAVLGFQPDLERHERTFLYVHYMDTHKPYHARTELMDGTGRSALERYDSEIRYVDSMIGRLHDALGWDDDTLIVLLADHGEEFGEHGGTGHTNTLYAELLRVPLVLSWPAALAARRVSENVSLIDVLPTLEAMGGASSSSVPTSGRSLVPLLRGGTLGDRTIFAMRSTETVDPPRVRKAALAGPHKYILSLPENTEQLFDRDADPLDQQDVSARKPEVVAQLREALRAFERTVQRHERVRVESKQTAAELSEQLRSLGYVQ
jgi:choline-sulfatase